MPKEMIICIYSGCGVNKQSIVECLDCLLCLQKISFCEHFKFMYMSKNSKKTFFVTKRKCVVLLHVIKYTIFFVTITK